MTQLQDTTPNTAAISSAQTQARPPFPALCPPTYAECRATAWKSSVKQNPEPGSKWLTIKCKDDRLTGIGQTTESTSTTPLQAHQRSQERLKLACAPSRSASSSPSGTTGDSLLKVPELCHIMSQFQETQSTLHGHAKAIFRATETLFTLRKELMNIHEYWMEVGMHEMAHDLIPILDLVDQDMPRYTFPSMSNTVAPIM